MKTKFHFQTSEVKVHSQKAPQQDVSKSMILPAVHVEGEVECTVDEIRELWVLQKEVLKESPDLIADFVKKLFETGLALEEFKKQHQHTVEAVLTEDSEENKGTEF